MPRYVLRVPQNILKLHRQNIASSQSSLRTPQVHIYIPLRAPLCVCIISEFPKRTENVVWRTDTDNYRAERGYVLTSHHSFTQLLTDIIAGTDSSQGKGQIISNINACLAVQDTIRSTLGPYGGDLLLVDENGRQTITNDGATVMKVRYSLQTQHDFMLIRLTASRHRSPCCTNPDRHCAIPRCRSRRWHNLSGCFSWRNSEGDQGSC